jgi:hypothetical protein
MAEETKDNKDTEIVEETFDDLFDKAALEVDGVVTTETTEDKKATETSTKQEEVDKKAEKETEKESEKVETDDFKQKYSTLQGMFEKLSHDFEDLKKEKEVKKEKEPEKPEVTTPKTEERDEDLEKYLEEYDFIAKNQTKLTTKELNKIKDAIIKEISEKYDVPVKKVDALIEKKLDDEYNEHVDAIHGAHKDYGKKYQKSDIETWIDTFSGTQKKVYRQIFEDGDTDEVIELIGNFKEVKGFTDKKDIDSDAENKAKEKEEKDKKIKEEKENKLKEMETVEGHKKSAIGGNFHRAEDFDSAFDEATKEK